MSNRRKLSPNVTSVRNSIGQITEYSYNSDNELTQMIQKQKQKEDSEQEEVPDVVTSYEYDDWHNVTKVTKTVSDNTTVTQYNYDNYGNLEETRTTNGNLTQVTSSTYSDNGNVLVSTTDAAGKTTNYGYEAHTNRLLWVQYPGETAATRTNYVYDEMNRLVTVSTVTDQGETMTATYSYVNDMLTTISTLKTTYSIHYGTFAQRSNIQIGSKTLASYTYNQCNLEDDDASNDNNYLTKLAYGNGDVVKYTYDKDGRVTQEKYYENGDEETVTRTITYSYDYRGLLDSVYDSQNGTAIFYYYDAAGRVVRESVSDGTSSANGHGVSYVYDENGNISKIWWNANNIYNSATYTYDDQQRVIKTAKGLPITTYAYDGLDRLVNRVVHHGGFEVVNDTIQFGTNADGYTTNQVTQFNTESDGSYSATYQYTYDDKGNITQINDGTYTTKYYYDSQSQLIREDNPRAGKIWVWTYDAAGNIQSKKEYAYTTGTLGTATDTITYTYGNSTWGDLLTNYDGYSISYDSIGNPLNDGTWAYTWLQGRQLTRMTSNSSPNTYWAFTYDANGLRASRTNGSTVYKYTYDAGLLTLMSCGDTGLGFTYDANGKPIAVNYSGSNYYYALNLQGDVVAILDNGGNPVVRYTYDAWGRHLSISGTMASTLGQYNPFRYRGYIYDSETKLYYLQSRYYDPDIGRFINADSLLNQESALGNNMFAYCFNNPINMADTTGELPFFLVTAAIGAVAGAVIGGIAAAQNGGDIWAGIGIGAVAGGLVGAGFGAATGAALAGSLTATTA